MRSLLKLELSKKKKKDQLGFAQKGFECFSIEATTPGSHSIYMGQIET